MDAARLADLIAGKARVRAGGVEGVLDGFTSRVLWLVVDGVRTEVPDTDSDFAELEPLDEQRVAAHWAAVEAENRRVEIERAGRRVKADLLAIDAAAFDAVVRDPAVAARIAAAPQRGTSGR